MWVQEDALNAYTYDFDIYTGKEPVDENGLGYSVVITFRHHYYIKGTIFTLITFTLN